MTDPDLDHFTAEQLASGTAELAADHAYAPVADLFAVLRQDALPEELLAEVPVVARLVEVINDAALGADDPRRQPVLRKFLSARFAAATIIGVASLGGVAAAATGSLPSSVQRAVADAVAPVINLPGAEPAGNDAGEPDATTTTTGVTAPAGTPNVTTSTTAETQDSQHAAAWTNTPASAPCPDPDRPGYAKTHPDTSTTDTDSTSTTPTSTAPTSIAPTSTTPTSTLGTTGPQGRACGHEVTDDRGNTSASSTSTTSDTANPGDMGGNNGNNGSNGHDGNGSSGGHGPDGPPAGVPGFSHSTDH